MNILEELQNDIRNVLDLVTDISDLKSKVYVEAPKDKLNGDLSSNIAMVIAAREGKNPREVALKFKEVLNKVSYIAHIEVAGAGFINFTIKAEKWQETLQKILADVPSFSSFIVDKPKKINIEFVSANPTGPLHIGHARCAVYGDALARLLSECGHEVTKEYYINDAGVQIENLVQTVMLRYKEAVNGQKIEIPHGLYPGEYLIPIAELLKASHGDSLLSLDESDAFQIVREKTLNSIMESIVKDLEYLGINYDLFVSENGLHKKGLVENIVGSLTNQCLIYPGVLPAPKGKEVPEWTEKEQLLFRSTDFGDEQDRVVQKSDGSWTYFASDLAYAKDKIDRKFDTLVYVLGADHGGYVSRIKGTVEAIGLGKVTCEVKICQLVNFIEDGRPLRMSKRAGKFTTVREVIEEVGSDIIRFIMLTRKNDAVLDFDLIRVKEQSKENPVFYVQYAHVRTISILSNALENLPEAYRIFRAGDVDYSLLSSEEEIGLIKALALWTRALELSCNYFEPHRVVFFLINLASKFHSVWNLGKENNDYRFVVPSDLNLTAARIALVTAVGKIIERGLKIIGIEPLRNM